MDPTKMQRNGAKFCWKLDISAELFVWGHFLVCLEGLNPVGYIFVP
jgi:hypothetical protein